MSQTHTNPGQRRQRPPEGIRINMRRHGFGLAVVVALLTPAAAFADAVTYWNEKAATPITKAGGGPLQARVSAMVQIAVHDALNAIEPRYQTYSALPPANPLASREAAIARATRDVLFGAVPAMDKVAFDQEYNLYVDGLHAGCDPALTNCVEVGEAAGAAAAAAILRARALDGSENPHRPYTLAPGPGVYQPTKAATPTTPAVELGGWGEVKTFALGNARQFFPGRAQMLDVATPEYAADYNEVKNVGSFAVRNAAPDSEQSRIARFWPNGGRDYNAIVRTIINAYPDRDLLDNAQLFALVNMATADASIATFTVKYHYLFWRPVTAIRWGEEGNPATSHSPEDATWTSYITTPGYPDYTCGLPTLVGASTGMLRAYFGTDDIAFAHTASGMTRQYASLSQAADEAISARVYGGIHFRTGCVRAVEQAEDVANFIHATQLKPLDD
ncbi:MAG TPA: vanadium-dependent haloperoxidase [Lysobacter sp.]